MLGGLYLLILTILKAEVTTAIVARERPGRLGVENLSRF